MTPGPNYDLLCDPDENGCSKSSRTAWTAKNTHNLSYSLKVNEILANTDREFGVPVQLGISPTPLYSSQEMPESPYLRIGFHVAASYDRKLKVGGWGDLPTRHAVKSAGLLDDILNRVLGCD